LRTVLTFHLQLPADRLKRQPLAEQAVHCGVPRASVVGPPALDPGQVVVGGWRVATALVAFRRDAQAAAVRGDHLAHRLGQVVHQVPPVGHLHRLRGAGGCALGVATSPVPANHLHPGMIQQPGGERARFTIGQHVNRLTGLHIDQDGGVAVTPPPGELVHPQHPRRRDRRVRHPANDPQKRGAADRHGHPVNQPRTGPSTQRHRDRLYRLLGRRGTASVASGQPFDLLGERPLGAVGLVAEEPAHPQRHQHLPPATPARPNRRVDQPTLVAAVHPG
jgi:hypothetical protein